MSGPIKQVPAGTSAADFDVSGMLGVPGILAGVVKKLGPKVTDPKALELLKRLLGSGAQSSRSGRMWAPHGGTPGFGDRVPLAVAEGKKGFLDRKSVV